VTADARRALRPTGGAGTVARGRRPVGARAVLALADGRRLGIPLDDPVTPAALIDTRIDWLRGGDP
jgi:hypothetical protein